MNKIFYAIADLLSLLVGCIWYGLLAFIEVMIGCLYVASVILTFKLILDLLAQDPIPWYEIVSPIIVFLGIGVFLYLTDD